MNIRLILALPMLISMLLSSAAFADLRKGEAAFDNKDYETALREYRAAAEAGEREGIVGVLKVIKTTQGGVMPKEGYGRWLIAAADRGHGESAWELAVRLTRGDGLDRNPEAARHYAVIAAKDRFAPALLIVGRNLVQGSDGFQRNIPEGVLYLALSAQQDNAEAMVILAGLFLSGEGVDQDDFAAVVWADFARGVTWEDKPKLNQMARQIGGDAEKRLSTIEKYQTRGRRKNCVAAIWICAQRKSEDWEVFDKVHSSLDPTEAIQRYFKDRQN